MYCRRNANRIINANIQIEKKPCCSIVIENNQMRSKSVENLRGSMPYPIQVLPAFASSYINNCYFIFQYTLAIKLLRCFIEII